MPDLRQSPEFAHYMKKLGWVVGKEKNFQFYIRHLPFFGNFIKIQRPPSLISPKKIKSLAKKYRAFAVQVNYSPTKTLQLDLTFPLNQIWKQMKKDARYEIKKAKKNKIIVKQSEDIELFIKLWHRNALRRGFWVPFGKEIRSIYEAFKNKKYLLLAFCSNDLNHDNKPLGGALILISDKTAYYFHAASTPKGRKLSASYLVVWEGIKLAKKKGCRIFDFEGIEDPRYKETKKWAGFSHFKKSFGGKEIEYPRDFIQFYNPILKFIYKL